MHCGLKMGRCAVIALFAFIGFGFVVMSLWNWLMPELFGARPVTFWQAIGLLALSRILLGGFRPHAGPLFWRFRMADRWEKMNPEERERFREGLRHCGPPPPWAPPPGHHGYPPPPPGPHGYPPPPPGPHGHPPPPPEDPGHRFS